jgi:hypothetical protein
MAASLRTAIDGARASAVPSSRSLPQARVVGAVARVESRKMLRHPVFLLAIAFGLLLLRGTVGLRAGDGRLVVNLVWLVAGVAVGSLIGSALTANVAALRPRRDHLLELFGSLPSPAEARTAGVLAGVAVGLGGLAAVIGGLAWFGLERYDDTASAADLFLAVQYPLSVLGLAVLGIAVARWIPSVLGGPLIVVAHVFTGIIWAVPWIATTDSDIARGWHLAYLGAVIVGFAGLAFLRDRRTLLRALMVVAAFALATVAVLQQTPPGGY